MKILLTIQKILRLVKIGIAITTMASLSACASRSWVKQANSGLPIEAVHSGSGTIMTFWAHETSDRLYVHGLAKSHQLVQPMHVDVKLIAADGRVIAEKTGRLGAPRHPRTSSGNLGHQSFVASFPLSEARQGAKIRVVYHTGQHSTGDS